MIAQLATDRRVESVQPLNEFTTESVPETLGTAADTAPLQMPYNDPYAKLQVSLRELAVVTAQRQSRGTGVQIAVIDTGVDFDHPDLKGRVVARRNFVDADERQFQRDKHGTEVSGVIAAVADNGIGIVGIAPDARVIALKACWQAAVRWLCGVQQLHAGAGARGGDCRARQHREHESGGTRGPVAGATRRTRAPCRA